jgi:hypothetical protein
MDEDQKPSRPNVIATTVQNLQSVLIHTTQARIYECVYTKIMMHLRVS